MALNVGQFTPSAPTAPNAAQYSSLMAAANNSLAQASEVPARIGEYQSISRWRDAEAQRQNQIDTRAQAEMSSLSQIAKAHQNPQTGEIDYYGMLNDMQASPAITPQTKETYEARFAPAAQQQLQKSRLDSYWKQSNGDLQATHDMMARDPTFGPATADTWLESMNKTRSDMQSLILQKHVLAAGYLKNAINENGTTDPAKLAIAQQQFDSLGIPMPKQDQWQGYIAQFPNLQKAQQDFNNHIEQQKANAETLKGNAEMYKAMHPAAAITLGAKEGQFDQKEYDKVISDAATPLKSGRGAIGTAQTNIGRANRGLNILNGEIVDPQQVVMLGGDLAGMIKAGSPDELGMKTSTYNSLQTDMAKAQQYFTGNAIQSMPNTLKKRLASEFQDMKESSLGTLKQHFDAMENAKKNVIDSNPQFRQQWNQFRGAYEDPSYGIIRGPGAAAQPHPQDNDAVEWAKANPNDPRAAKIMKANGL